MLDNIINKLSGSAHKAEKFGILLSIIIYTLVGGAILGLFHLWLIPVGVIVGFALGIHKNRGRLLRLSRK